MDKVLRNQTLALAAVFQCAASASQLARTGLLSEQIQAILIESILKQEANSLEEIYGGFENLKSGLEILKVEFESHGQDRNLEIMRYAMSLLHLERRLFKKPDILKQIDMGIENAKRQVEYFGSSSPNVIASLASLYRETISVLGPRIIIQGDENFLSNDNITSRIRMLLLAGIRAAVLWQQAGGSRLSLLFSRKAILRETARLLTS